MTGKSGPTVRRTSLATSRPEAHAVFEAAAVFVFPPVYDGGKKLADQVAGRGNDLHGIEPGPLHPAGGEGEVCLDLPDLRNGQLAGRFAGKFRTHRRRGNRLPSAHQQGMGISPGLIELGGNLGPVRLDRPGQGRKPRDEFVVLDADHVHGAAEVVNGAASDDDQGRPASGPLDEIIRVVGQERPLPGRKEVHGRHDDPVLEFHLADADGRKEFFQHCLIL